MLRRAWIHVMLVGCVGLVVCGGDGEDDPDGDDTVDTEASTDDTDVETVEETGCVGGGACTSFDDTQCMVAVTFGLPCVRETADACLFGSYFGTPANPGCATQTTAGECASFSAGCRWDGMSCVFKACHTRTDETACTDETCVWSGNTCYYAECPTLDLTTCANFAGCTAASGLFAGCSGTYTCEDFDLGDVPLPPGTTDEDVCDELGNQGFPCSWVAP